MVIERYLDHTGNLEGRGHTLPPSVFKHISAEEKAELLLELFDHYRRVGYPHQPTEEKWRESQWKSLMKTDALLLDGKVVKQTMLGLPLAWSFHRHAPNVQVGTNQSCMEAFKDDEHFKAILKYRMNTGGYFNNAGLRKALKIHTGVQGVSNFRPTAASTIYLHFLKDVKNSVVWDPCAGFSGRLLGACLAGVGKYVGCDPCVLTYEGLKKTKSFIREHQECRTETSS